MSQARLLILDDDELTGQTIKVIAEFAGISVELTHTPAEFFKQLDDWQPSHIAVDLIMPEMDGVEVLVALAEKQVDAQIIITSGVGHRVLEAAARSAAEHGLNILGILPKPFNPSSFRELMQLAPAPATVSKTVTADNSTRQVNAELLAQALQDRQISVAYQPKIECRTGGLIGFEVLARWQHPQLGVISPDVFIQLAEQHQLIDHLTLQVFEQALPWFKDFCRQCAEAPRSPASGALRLSVNVSASSLGNGHLFEQIQALCQQHGLQATNISLELTETATMADPLASLEMLTRLRMKGFHLALDDFGTGFSSMVQLVRSPFSEVKIDKSFVMTALKSHESRLVTQAIIDLAHGLDLQVTAEGIEDQDTLKFLQDLKCDYGQGYLIGRPVPKEGINEWLLQRQQHIEQQRIETLHELNVLDTPPEDRFDRITRLAKRLFNVPITLISFIDNHRQWFKSRIGVDVCETSRDVAFCSIAIEQDGLFVVSDASLDPRFAENALVTGPPFIRFYAGYPVRAPSGEKLGTICIIDHTPRELSVQDAKSMQELALMVEEEIATNKLLAEDHLTGLLNRRGFESRAAHVLQLCQSQGLMASLIYIDLDNFKQINDAAGHQAGDEALHAFAGLLNNSFRESDLIARIGGDEFAVLLANHHQDDIPMVMQRLAGAVRDFNEQINPALQLHYSYGVASVASNDNYALQQLYTLADEAMYNHKRFGKKPKNRG